MKKTIGYITINNKKHKYSLEKRKSNVFFECLDANISQEFLAEDIPSLLIDLPNLIMAEKEYNKNQSEIIRFRVSSEDKHRIKQKAVKCGYNSISKYMRDIALSK